jgi:integrase
MTNICGMYEKHNAFDFAQFVLNNKTLAPSTRDNWQRLIKYLNLDQYEMPITDKDIYKIVERYSNPRTKKSVILTLNSLFGTKAKSGPSLPLDLDLPCLDEVSEYFDKSDMRMYFNLMLHAGLRIGETLVKHKMTRSGIDVQFQRIKCDNTVQPAKTRGVVVLPDWLYEEYKSWEPLPLVHQAIRERLKNRIRKSPWPYLTPHKFRHIYASHYANLMPVAAVQKQMRHSTSKTTLMYYTHVKESDILKVLNVRQKNNVVPLYIAR